ncbi:1706_t:CDS:1, partial [Dentiscutata heterogama]
SERKYLESERLRQENEYLKKKIDKYDERYDKSQVQNYQEKKEIREYHERQAIRKNNEVIQFFQKQQASYDNLLQSYHFLVGFICCLAVILVGILVIYAYKNY